MKSALATCLSIFFLAVGSAHGQVSPPLQSDYYPLKIGQRWTYLAIDLKTPQAKPDPKKNVVVVVEKEEIYTRKKLDKGGKELSEKFTGYLLKSTSGDKTSRDQVIVLEEGIHRVATAGTPMTPPLLIFKLPLKDGESWKVNSASGSAIVKGTFTAKHEKITVPAGSFDAMAIVFRSSDDPAAGPPVEIDYWFAQKVGMVKQRVKTKNHEIVLELQKFEDVK
jgi:hypothetical protein